jgi:hypothetical protein
VQLQQTYAPARNSKKRLLLLIIKTILLIESFKKQKTKIFIITLREKVDMFSFQN